MNELNTKKIWHDVLETIKINVSPANFTTWFKQTHLISLKNQDGRYIAEIGCSSPFTKNTIETRYFGLIQDNLTKSLNSSCDLIFTVKSSSEYEGDKEKKPTPLFENYPDKENLFDSLIRAGIRIGFTFENFAVSSSNQMAWAAAEAVTKNIGKAYNPLFIWGGVGVGKTHLMSAVGHRALEQDPNTPVLFCTGEQFTNDIVEGIRNKNTPAVRNKYRKLKILLIDDIQFIAGKDAVQEEFFHTFNALVFAGAQIILTSDKPPSDIPKLEERLRSRFEAGLIVDIAPPDFELRCAITQIKAQEKNIPLEMDLIHLIAGNLESARKIEGFLTKLLSETTTKKISPTKEIVENLLGKKGENDIKLLKATPNDILSAVSKYYSLGKRSLLGNIRARSIARPRQILMYLLRKELSLPYKEIGRLIGGRDHTTVMHAVEKITNLVSTSMQVREDLRGIKNMI